MFGIYKKRKQKVKGLEPVFYISNESPCTELETVPAKVLILKKKSAIQF
jgi:hypothetical protein